MDLRTERVHVAVDGSNEMEMYVAHPDAAKPNGAAVMVFQEAFGVKAHIRDVAHRMAAEGYLAVAPELFHRTAPAGYEGSYEDYAAIAPHVRTLTADMLEADIRATHAWLVAQGANPSRIGAIGFCLGGRTSYIANSILPLKAAVSFYGGGLTGEMLGRSAHQHGPIMFVWGGLDKHITPEIREGVSQSMREAAKPFISLEISYADHGFMCFERAAYSPEASAEAWPLTMAFFERNLKSA